MTGRDGAGKLSVCDWFGSLARSSPCRKEVTTAWVSAVAWAAWTNSCCERRAASEVGARAADHDRVGGFAAGAVQTAGSADRSVQTAAG
jgi:hypothetical protein